MISDKTKFVKKTANKLIESFKYESLEDFIETLNSKELNDLIFNLEFKEPKFFVNIIK